MKCKNKEKIKFSYLFRLNSIELRFLDRFALELFFVFSVLLITLLLVMLQLNK